MTDVYQTVAENMAALRKQVETLTAERDTAYRVRDDAQAASNRSLEEKRAAEAKLKETRSALTFASSVIKSGESWSNECEIIIGGALK